MPIFHQVIGDTSDPRAATTEQFAEFWHEIAKRFRDNEKVIFGINNEPHDMVSMTSAFTTVGSRLRVIRTQGSSWKMIKYPPSTLINISLYKWVLECHVVRGFRVPWYP